MNTTPNSKNQVDFQENKVKYFHLHQDRRLVGTLATYEVGDNVVVASTVVSPKDQPRRKLGRQIAHGRLKAWFSGRQNQDQVFVQEKESFVQYLLSMGKDYE